MKLSTRRIGSAHALLLGVLFQFGSTISTALSPDPRLLSLVPPDSQIVAGASAPSKPGQGLHFLFVSRANHFDFADFVALAASDPSHVIREVILTTTISDRAGDSQQHSLLASGHFDTTRIFESARASSKIGHYHGIPVLQVDPFERERAIFHDQRWLAIIDSRVAMFGTFSTVEQEIDRYLTAAKPDASIMQRLELLRDKDETWCLISSLDLGTEIRGMVEKLDPALGKLVENTHSFQFGIRCGRQFELEYVVNAVPIQEAEDISNSQIPVDSVPPGRWSFSSRTVMIPMGGLRGIVKVSRSRYEKWLGEFAAQ
jgi:hypothetical protein